MRLVVKVGTSSLTHKTGLLNIRKVQKLCVTLSDTQNAGPQVILVSSGAIGMGVGKLHLDRKPTDMATKQAAAAVGQCELMYVYDKLFGEYNHTVAQILLTGNDVDNEIHRENIRSTISRLLELGVIPIINENDSVATAEIDEINALGDNDTLAAIVSVCIGADLQGTGGMRTMVKAAKLVCENGIDMVITNGDTPENLYGIVDGDPIGTRFLKKK